MSIAKRKSPILTKDARQQFAKKMELELEMNNYGFVSPNSSAVYTDAVKELLVRLKVFVALGRKDSGKIPFPEANRLIMYQFHPDDTGKCFIRLKALSKGTKYQYVEKEKNKSSGSSSCSNTGCTDC